MNIKASAHKGYILKYLLIGLAALAFGLIHFKDAIFVYPGLRPMAKTFEEFRGPLDENGKSVIPDGELQSGWKALAAENDWPEEFPKLNDEIDNLLLYNYFIGIIFTPIALLCLWNVVTTLGRSVELEGDQLTDHKGNTIDIKNIVAIDKKRWEKKGLVTLTAKANGQTEKILLDDLKFERRPVDEIMMHIEKTVGEDKIINGETEAFYEKKRLEKLAEREARKAEMDRIDEDA